MAFITPIAAPCQQSNAGTLPQNCAFCGSRTKATQFETVHNLVSAGGRTKNPNDSYLPANKSVKECLLAGCALLQGEPRYHSTTGFRPRFQTLDPARVSPTAHTGPTAQISKIFPKF